MRSYVDDINKDPNALAQGQRGPCSRYELPDEDLKGRLEIKFFDNVGKGVACNLESKGEQTVECVSYAFCAFLAAALSHSGD